jgi:hypothetical protein
MKGGTWAVEWEGRTIDGNGSRGGGEEIESNEVFCNCECDFVCVCFSYSQLSFLFVLFAPVSQPLLRTIEEETRGEELG